MAHSQDRTAFHARTHNVRPVERMEERAEVIALKENKRIDKCREPRVERMRRRRSGKLRTERARSNKIIFKSGLANANVHRDLLGMKCAYDDATLRTKLRIDFSFRWRWVIKMRVSLLGDACACINWLSERPVNARSKSEVFDTLMF